MLSWIQASGFGNVGFADFGSVAEKRRIVELTLEPGASVALVARAHGVNANQVFEWRRAFERGELVEPAAACHSFASGYSVCCDARRRSREPAPQATVCQHPARSTSSFRAGR